MENNILPISSTAETKRLHWQYLFRTINIFLSLTLLVILLIGGTIGKIELCIIMYLCIVVAIENLYRTGDLAGILYFMKRQKP